MNQNAQANTYDCGDGVPDLDLRTNGDATNELALQEISAERQPIGPALAFLILTVIGQLVILLAVLAGGNPLVGAVAGLALLGCALTVLGARTLRQVLFEP